MKLRLLLPAGIFILVLFSGCYGVDSEFKSIRNVTLKEYGKNFITDKEFAIGSFELWLIESIVSIVEPDEVAAELASSISEVQVGTYLRKGRYEIPTKNILLKIDKQMERKGWKFLVKSYKQDEMAAVYINKDSEKMLKELFVVQIDNKEMIIAHISGNLEKVIELAIREEGFWYDKHEGKVIAGKF